MHFKKAYGMPHHTLSPIMSSNFISVSHTILGILDAWQLLFISELKAPSGDGCNKILHNLQSVFNFNFVCPLSWWKLARGLALMWCGGPCILKISNIWVGLNFSVPWCFREFYKKVGSAVLVMFYLTYSLSECKTIVDLDFTKQNYHKKQ